eukprot:CAMPEP_0202730570 /NCGR_PEP_ID=MMETSP1385-20130828/186707_1 /ASSEMBLY_ACC=CAM_ASM_000861 /TAXON_ID=933848 /ORGANISM="Elphidium margaritaceum" /LENGTH=152 /DNA_ID=CAMNT_0049396847 /DNA_START=24 /DNA_END=485 /DNA_ORIENTATION=+
MNLNAQCRLLYEDTDAPADILCGAEVFIKHRSSELCLTMTNELNLTQTALHKCHEMDAYQIWIIQCCDEFLLRCGRYNPFLSAAAGSDTPLTYATYFQIQHKMSKLCMSTASLWAPSYASNGNKSAYLQQCQLSLLDVTDSMQSTKIQRDKF